MKKTLLYSLVVVLIVSVAFALINTEKNMTNSSSIEAGDIVQFTINISDNGTIIENYTLIDDYDVNFLNFIGYSITTGEVLSYSANNTTGQINWTINITSGFNITVNFTAMNDGNTQNNATTYNESLDLISSDSEDITIFQPPVTNYTLDKELDAPPPYTIGTELHFTLNVSNEGNQDVENLTLSDVFDETYFSYVNSTVMSGDNQTPASSTNGTHSTLNWTVNLTTGTRFIVDLVLNTISGGDTNNTALLYDSDGTLNSTAYVNVTIESGGGDDPYSQPDHLANCGGNVTVTGTVLLNGTDVLSNYSSIQVMAFPMMIGPPGQEPSNNCTGRSSINSSGEYIIMNMTEGDYIIHLDTYGTIYANSETIVEDLVNDSNNTVNFNLTEGGIITGLAFVNTSSSENTTFDGSADAFSPYTFQFGGWAEILANGTGEFNITGVPEGTFQVNIRSYDGTYSQTTINDVVVVAGQTTNISNATGEGAIYLDEGITINGTITDLSTGNGIASAMIDIFNEDTFSPSFGESNDTGNYSITGLSAGTNFIRVMPPTGTDYSTYQAQLLISESDDVIEMNFTLRQGIKINGTVNMSNGTPLAYVDVMAFPINAMPGPNVQGSGFTFTDENGYYTINGLEPNTNYQIEVDTQWNPLYSSLGLQRGTHTVMTGATYSESDDEINFTLSTGHSITGYVTESNGSSLSSAFVNAWIPPSEPNTPPSSVGFSITNSDGFYNITGLIDGTYEMHVEPPFARDDLSGASRHNVTVSGSDVNETNFTLTSGGSVAGRLVDSSGNGLSGIFVDVWKEAGGWSSGMSNVDGYFTVKGLATDTDYNLVVHPFNSLYTTHTEKVDVTAGQETSVGEITLTQGVQLHGYVLNDGTPETSANVELWSQSTMAWGHDISDGSGIYNITGLSEGYYDARVRLSSGKEKFFSNISVNGSEYNFTFGGSGEGFGNLTVNVTNSTDGNPIPDAMVNVFNPTLYQGKTGTTNTDGEKNFTELVNGSGYKVIVNKIGYEGNFSVSEFTIAINSTTTINVTLNPITVTSYFINGTVSGNQNVTTMILAVENTTNPLVFSNVTYGDDNDHYIIYSIPQSEYNIKAIKGTTIANYSGNPVTLDENKEINLSFS